MANFDDFFTVLISLISIAISYGDDDQFYFDQYKNIRIESGRILQITDLNGDTNGQFHCIEACRKTSGCKMVVHDTSNGSQCILWDTDQQNTWSPVHDVQATLFTRQGCKYVTLPNIG